MNLSRQLSTIPVLLMVAACGAGTPLTEDQAKDKLRESFSDDGYKVTWVNVVPKAEPGKFRAFIDRVKDNDPEKNETQLCNTTLTSNSSSWTCQAAKPSIMTQAANMLSKDYKSRNIEVRNYHLERTGNGNAFTGYFEVTNPATGKAVRVPCKGDQKEANFDIDCDQSYAEGQET